MYGISLQFPPLEAPVARKLLAVRCSCLHSYHRGLWLLAGGGGFMSEMLRDTVEDAGGEQSWNGDRIWSGPAAFRETKRRPKTTFMVSAPKRKKPDETRGRTKRKLRHCCKSFAKTGCKTEAELFFFFLVRVIFAYVFFFSSGCCWKVVLQCLLWKSPLSHCLRINFNTAARLQGCHSDLFVVSAHISLIKQASHMQSEGT